MTLRISIVTPSYNQGSFIERALLSVLRQTPAPHEYLVVDGGSSDSTLDILKRHPVRWVSEPGAGPADAVNQGIRATTGEIIGWLNSDDIYYPGALAAVLVAFAQDPAVDVIYGAANYIDTDGRVIDRYPTEDWNLARLRERCYLCQPAVFFRRSVISRWGELNPSLHYCMDYEYWLRLGFAGAHFRYLPHLLAGSRASEEKKTPGRRVQAHAEINDMLRNRLGAVPAWWLYDYGKVVAEKWPPAKNSAVAKAAAILGVGVRSAFRWNGWPRVDMIAWILRHGPRFFLRAVNRLGVLYQYPPRPLRLPSGRALSVSHSREWPAIALVTPSLNQHRFITRTVASVLSQDYPRLDYVVQDGGSIDGTINYLQHHPAESLRWYSEPDSGQANALNLGFRRTSGEIMAWLNSDDVLLPGALAFVGAFFAGHPDVDVIYSHRIVIDEEDREIGRWILPPHDYDVTGWVDYIPQETMFWRRSVWERVGACVDESFQFAMDWDLILRFQRVGARFKRLPTFLAAFRAHPDQKTSARMGDLGAPEITRLRDALHGRSVTTRDGARTLVPYLLKHIVLQRLHHAGLIYR